ncbi:MAG: nuclear transport factor 2 family protein [Pseudomonadales bacterium]
MNILEQFMAYAQDFEKTYADDDWSRLYSYFHDDAVYEVVSENMGCKLEGPAAIFAGIKKSLDGFDRRFQTREIRPGDDLQLGEDSISLSWSAKYTVPGQPPFVLHGRSEATLHNGKIRLLRDSYDASAAQAMDAWVEASGIALEPGYS